MADAIARYTGLHTDNVLLGAGVDDLISLVTLWVHMRNGNTTNVAIRAGSLSFGEFARAAKRHGLDFLPSACTVCRLHGGDRPTSVSSIEAVRPVLEWVVPFSHLERPRDNTCQSDAPVSSAIVAVDYTLSDWGRFRRRAAKDAALGRLALFSFSKFFGLPGARIGALVCNRAIAAELRALQVPYPVATSSLALANEALASAQLARFSASYGHRLRTARAIARHAIRLRGCRIMLSASPYFSLLHVPCAETREWLRAELCALDVRHWTGATLESEVASPIPGLIRIETSASTLILLNRLPEGTLVSTLPLRGRSSLRHTHGHSHSARADTYENER